MMFIKMVATLIVTLTVATGAWIAVSAAIGGRIHIDGIHTWVGYDSAIAANGTAAIAIAVGIAVTLGGFALAVWSEERK